MNPSSVKHYSKKTLQNLDFFLFRTKQPFSFEITIFSQFSENVCQNAKKIQASDITSLRLHNRQELKKKTENKTLLGTFIQFQPQPQVNTVSIEHLNQFGVQQTACSKTISEIVPIASSFSTNPQQALP